jgi:hypothetical protein
MAIVNGQPNPPSTGTVQPIDVTGQPSTGGTSPSTGISGPPVPPGQTPLASLPTYGGSGGDATSAAYYAGQDFYNMFGRNPTAQELAQLTPAYIDPNGHIANLAGGKAQVAAYYQQQTNTPENIYNQQQQQYLTQAPQFANQVTSAFQTELGRAPTADELSHFGALMASGQDAYQVQQALQQTQEYQNTQNTNFQNQLQGQLQQSNSTYFNQFIAPSLQAQNAQSGQAPGSSALTAQLSQAALQQNQGLQNFLAGVTAQNYQNSTANASNQYNQLMSQQYGLQNANVTSGIQNQQNNTAYNQQLNLYQMQQQAYNNYLNQYGKRSGNQGIGQLAGGILGAGVGAYATGGSPQGIGTGYSVGSGLGGGIGALI